VSRQKQELRLSINNWQLAWKNPQLEVILQVRFGNKWMERWQLGQRSLNFLGRQSPPQIVEGVMLLLAIMLCIAWMGLHSWPYLVLSLSYIVGAIASILARDAISPSAYTRWIRLAALSSLGLLVLIGFALLQETLSLSSTGL
jgi:hypothetical protein